MSQIRDDAPAAERDRVVVRRALSDRHKDAVRLWAPRARALLEGEFDAQLEVELASTLLNRLVGLKAMEARELLYLPPPGDAGGAPQQTEVLTPLPDLGRSRYLRDLRAAGGSRYEDEGDAEEALLRDGLTAAFRFISRDMRPLFDRDHEHACVWPAHGTLVNVIRMINEDLPEDAYRAQDFLGWVYQFCNREEKKRVRRATKGTPRSAYELAVINQFYTPAWVVKALVDNTLGRLWIQMHPDSALRPTRPPPLPHERTGNEPSIADYLVPCTGERIRYQRRTEDGRLSTYKRAKDIALLDPACGTMHFGQYAFGLFHRMYLDEIEHAGQDGWPPEPSVADPKEIPAAILEHNLHGIDIDPRAVHIAALSLLLTAKEAALAYGGSPLGVRVKQTNLVVAGGELGSLVPVRTARAPKLNRMLGRRYDVVVMNPPYGRFVPRVKALIRAAYPLAANDIYAAFLDRATQIVEPEGYVGALVSSTFADRASFEKLRTEILLERNPLVAMLDLGTDILDDATVQAAAVVLRGGPPTSRAGFFDLSAFRNDKATRSDAREEVFARALAGHDRGVRFDVAHGDFGAISGSPLAYRSVGLIASAFRASPPLDPACATVKQGLATADDDRWLRARWEIPRSSIGLDKEWAPLAKGGEFSRFYYDHHLLIRWANGGRELKDHVIAKEGSASKRIYSQGFYGKPGLTWPLRTQRGFNVRVLPPGFIFSHKGPGIFPVRAADADYLLGIMSSAMAELILRALTSFGSWEVGVVKRLPVPQATVAQRARVGRAARLLHDAKARWDRGNEVSTRFVIPWLLEAGRDDRTSSLAACLDRLAELESSEQARIQRLYAELNDDVYRLYGVSGATRAIIEQTLGERPPEVLWPQMEGKAPDQKRMEHVFRLLSYAVKRIVEADGDGVVPFYAAAGEPPLVERLRRELAHLFPGRDPSQLEVEIVGELDRSAKGYRRARSLAAWLENVFFDHHVRLYRNRPIFWHIASAQGTARFAFGALVHYHRFGKGGMKKLRATYVRAAIDRRRRELKLHAEIEEIQILDRKLQDIQEGRHERAEGGGCDYRILTPWKAPEDRPRGWDPDLDDGVKVNLSPLQKAGVLRSGRHRITTGPPQRRS